MRYFTKTQQIILLAIGLTVLAVNLLSPLYSPFSIGSTREPQAHHKWAIEVAGLVREPGIYTFNNSPTPYQAIQEAGGMLTKCPVPLEGLSENLQSGVCIETERAWQGQAQFHLSRMNVRKMLVLGIPVDVNQAGAEELALIPGISHALASRIVEFRKSRSAFKTWHDLRKVNGVGPTNINSFRDYLQVSRQHASGPPSTDVGQNAAKKNEARSLDRPGP